MTEYEKDEDGNLVVKEVVPMAYTMEQLLSNKAFKEGQIAELIAKHNEHLALLTTELTDIEALIVKAEELNVGE